MAAAGLTPEDFGVETIEIWPENEICVSLFSTLSTQWRMGFNGPVGLDYNVIFSLMGRMKLSETEYDNLFADMRVVETEALSIINKRES